MMPTTLWQTKGAVQEFQALGRQLIAHANDIQHAMERLQTPYANLHTQAQWASTPYGPFSRRAPAGVSRPGRVANGS